MQTTKTIKAGERTQHTPGPWTFDVVPDKQRNDLAKMLFVKVPDGGFVRYELRTVYTKDHTAKFNGPIFMGTINEEANARLIAAAPELLEACRGLLVCLGSFAHTGTYPSPDEPEIIAARGVIAKAQSPQGWQEIEAGSGRFWNPQGKEVILSTEYAACNG